MPRQNTKSTTDRAGYVELCRWRNGWHLIEKDGQHYLRRCYRGQYKVSAVRDGLLWIITDPVTGERVKPDQFYRMR